MLRFVAPVLILMCVALNSFAAIVELDAATKRYDLGFYADYFEDVDGDLNLDEIIAAENQHFWRKNTAATPNFAFSNSVYWLRLNFLSTLSVNESWFFEIAFPLQDYIDYYVVDSNQVLNRSLTGDRRVFSTREVDYRNFLFTLDIPAGSQRQVYIRLDTADGLHEPSPMILWNKLEFTIQNGVRNLGLGLYFGIMIVMALYNLFVYFSMRDKAYFYYVAYIIGFSFWLFSYYGFSYQYLWPSSPILGNLSTVFLTSFWAIFMARFVCSFLNASESMPWFAKMMNVYIGCMIFTILSCFYGNYSFGILSVICFGMPAAVMGIVAGVQSWRSGYKPARFFLLAWCALLISLIIFSLKISGILPTIWVIERSVQIGSAIEVVLLSLGLADRINDLRKEKMTAQKEAIHSFESNMKLKNDFIASISHELRTPMNAIIGGVEAVGNKNLGEFAEPLKIIRSGANDMMRVVDDILIHTELQSGQLTLKPDSAEINSAMARLIDYYGSLCKARGLSFHSTVDSKVPAWITVDAHKLTVILTKLLNNAVKFTEKGDVKLRVSTDERTQPPQMVCIVSDTGLGISKESQAFIFDPFVQVEGGFTRRHDGMGIGLSICRRLAEMLNGTLTLKSSLGEGSCFTLRFPLEVGEPVNSVSTDNLAAIDLPVLVVEDNIVNQKVIVKMLAKMGLNSMVANHGQEALELLEKNIFSLILMDLQMPIMNGFSCTDIIRKSDCNYTNIPIIAVTANVMDKDKSQCFELKMNEFLEKPIKLNVLKDCLSQYIQLDH